jgi:hypothetical protein
MSSKSAGTRLCATLPAHSPCVLVRFNRKLLQDRDSPDQVIASFRTMCDDRETISADELGQPPLSAEDVALLKSRLPQAENGAACSR